MVGSIIDRVWPDPAQANAAKLQLLQLQQTGELAQITGQMEINKAEAANASTFVSGWRPFVGWVCGVACAWNWIGLPIARVLCAYFGKPITLVPADISDMMPVLMGMLGMGGLRTFEKLNKVAAK